MRREKTVQMRLFIVHDTVAYDRYRDTEQLNGSSQTAGASAKIRMIIQAMRYAVKAPEQRQCTVDFRHVPSLPTAL